MTKREIIKRLKTDDAKQRIYHDEIPIEYQTDKAIIKAERKAYIRQIKRIGFDVLKQAYFVHEEIICRSRIKQEYKTFEDFEEYYDYLDGDIYNKACYYQCDFSTIKRDVDKARMAESQSFINYTIDNFSLLPAPEEMESYKKIEKIKKQIKIWVKKFVSCDTVEKLKAVADSYKNSILTKEHKIDTKFFLWNYVFYDLNDKKRLNIIIEYLKDGSDGMTYKCQDFLRALDSIYGIDIVFNMYYSGETQKVISKHIHSTEECLSKNWGSKIYFDINTHFYCERTDFGTEDLKICSTYRYFETFEDLLKYRKNDLSDVDLREDYLLDYDFSKCITNKNTMLPLTRTSNVKYIIRKKYSNGIFKVEQSWFNENHVKIKNYLHKFNFFCDFVYYLKGDLSKADLIMCEGLINLNDISMINLTDALITSNICKKLGVEYKKEEIITAEIKSFKETEDNEENTKLILQSSREVANTDNSYSILSNNRIFYITDLHLVQLLHNYGFDLNDFRSWENDISSPHLPMPIDLQSKVDITYVLRKVISDLLKEIHHRDIILIGGDTSSDFLIYKAFVSLLNEYFNEKKIRPTMIFCLGNHDLWGPSFSLLPFYGIVEKFHELISSYNMYLLQNNILYEDFDGWKEISTLEIINLSEEEIRKRLRRAKIIFFGGLAFAGCNETFNAYNGIYLFAADREQEIEESKQFYALYQKVLKSAPEGKEVIVLTHMPVEDWAENVNYQKNYIYVNGHTHRNFFHDDGETRIYADNQSGYHNKHPHLKWFEIDPCYDYFANYSDGTYEISKDEYRIFHVGKNIMMDINWEVNVIYMLKKNGYYCFIHKSKNNSFTILNGGSRKKLDVKDIKYYYDNMDTVIKMIEEPLTKYTYIQEQIASEVRKIGGSGNIHGCIIDIDYYNHVYVNPVDFKITGYYALNIIKKKVYSSIPLLLKDQCPVLYDNYNKLLKSSSKGFQWLSKRETKGISLSPQKYLETDIYRASRIAKKMQKLDTKILSIWYEPDIKNEMAKIENEIKRITAGEN